MGEYMGKDNRNGSVTLELSLVLPIFILFFLFVYGLFAIVSAQNTITHALIQSTKSLSLDSYLTENVSSVAESSEVTFWSNLSDMVIDLVRVNNDPYFSSREDWYKTGKANTVARQRFIGYLTGGDEVAADEMCKALRVENGLSGITFDAKVENDELTVTIKYSLKYWFDFAGLGTIPMEQTIRTRMWK